MPKSIPVEIKNKLLMKSGYKCSLCHTDIALEIHSIVTEPVEERIDEDNYISLCANCHRRIHIDKLSSEELKKYRDLWYSLVERKMEKKIDLDQVTGYEFENLISKLLANMGYKVVRQLISLGNEIDIVAYDHSPILDQPITLLVECKHRKLMVGINDVRILYGKLLEFKSAYGIFITTTGFTKSAMDFAIRNNITLIDGEKLQSLLKDYTEKKGEKLPND